MPTRKASGYTLIIIVIIFGAAFLIQQYRGSQTADDTHQIVSTLQYNALRGDCIREITSDAEQSFRLNITNLLAAGRDPAKAMIVFEQMKKDARVNIAREVKRKCSPAIQPGTSVATTTTLTARDGTRTTATSRSR